MDRILSAYEPQAVFRFFEDICAIPHPSGHEEAIADYIESFAKERGLSYMRDKANNLFVRLPATPGCEGAEPVLLQGHTDMVPEKDPDSTHDFLTDGLTLSVEDGWIRADRTTLGGDDGVAVAIMLALLDGAPDPHPALECLFTVSEETGMDGAWAFDPEAAGLTAKTLLNLDSEAEGIVTAGCAGGVRTDITLPVTTQCADGVAVRVALSGFAGGHSGVEIHKGRSNAIVVLGQLLDTLSGAYAPCLVDLSGGGKDNAIPRAACARLILPADRAEAFCAAVCAEAELYRAEPSVAEEDRSFTCTAELLTDTPVSCLDAASTRRVLDLLTLVRSGVIAMSAYVPGLTAFSRNLGILSTVTDGEGRAVAVKFSFSSRSASEHQLDRTQRELERLAALLGGQASHHARYPGWEYAPTSRLRDIWTAESQRLFGVTPVVEVIHAGLECGILCGKRPGMDMISVGPDMRDIHTPREMLSIPSTRRTYELVCATLAALAKEYRHAFEELAR